MGLSPRAGEGVARARETIRDARRYSDRMSNARARAVNAGAPLRLRGLPRDSKAGDDGLTAQERRALSRHYKHTAARPLTVSEGDAVRRWREQQRVSR